MKTHSDYDLLQMVAKVESEQREKGGKENKERVQFAPDPYECFGE